MISPLYQGEVIFVDDEGEVRNSSTQTLELEGFQVTAFARAHAALESITPAWRGVVVTDVRMPEMDGLALLEKIVEIDADIPVIMISAHGDIPVAVAAIQNGAYDFVEKADDPQRLLDVVHRALEKRRLVIENRELRRELDSSGELECRIIGKTPAMEAVRQTVRELADTNVDVLVIGATGTGKEVVARALHEFGERGSKPFVALNCGALPKDIIESELFGHEAGSFTGAAKRRIGKIEYASGGTLFLDEIESMPQHIQVQLLRVLQERTIERLGGNEPIPVDIRVVSASKVDLRSIADQGDFREDLYYRLHVATIELPTLAQRREDIPLLFRHFADAAAARFRRAVPTISTIMAQELMAQEWPGNVRELRNAAERFVLGMFGSPTASGSADAASEAGLTLAEAMARYERDTIAAALREYRGRVGDTAAALGVPRKTLYLRMQKYRLDRDEFR